MEPSEAVFTRRALFLLIALLLGETTINFIDRQVLSVLAPTLRGEFHLSNSQYAAIINAFMATYAVAYAFAGYVLDRLGVGRGLTLSVTWWSAAGMLTALSRGPLSLGFFRGVLAVGEAGAWPAFAKATAYVAMKALMMAAYWLLLKWNSPRSVSARTESTWRSMKLMVVSPSSRAMSRTRAPRVKTASSSGVRPAGCDMRSK